MEIIDQIWDLQPWNLSTLHGWWTCTTISAVILVGATSLSHHHHITFIYPRSFRVAYAANISEHLTIIWEIDRYSVVSVILVTLYKAINGRLYTGDLNQAWALHVSKDSSGTAGKVSRFFCLRVWKKRFKKKTNLVEKRILFRVLYWNMFLWYFTCL